MIHLSINLPTTRLHVTLNTRRRRSGSVVSILRALEAIKRIRSGNKISRVFRHALERINIKAILGANLAAFVMLGGVLGSTGGVLAQLEPEATNINITEQPLATEVNVQYPTNPVIVNQGYHLFHLGIDLDGVKGDQIRPIKKGRVVKRETSRFGYGNAVLVEHEGGLQSLYAHLSKINVSEGEEVDTRSTIGEMGSTGRSTGDHLHLEIYRNGRPTNPRTVLGR